MYEVAVFYDPRPIGKARWVRITPRPLGLKAATELADLQPYRATVQVWQSNQVTYSNFKPPCLLAPENAPPPVQAPGRRVRRLDQLPRIVRWLEVVDGGEGGGASCPHCGAQGRWVYRFQVEDGRTLGAMKGCVKLFPLSPVAGEVFHLEHKRAEYDKKGWDLNQWDKAILKAAEEFYVGALTEAQALAFIRAQKAAATSWRKRRVRR